jgi:hypothetical protein
MSVTFDVGHAGPGKYDVTVTALPLPSLRASDCFDVVLARGRGNPVEACSVIVIVLGIGHTPDAPLLSQAMVHTFERYRVEVREL